MGQNADYFNNANQHYSFFSSKLFIVLLFNNALNLIFFNSIQNSHMHEPSKLIENLHHLHITTEKNVASNYCLK